MFSKQNLLATLAAAVTMFVLGYVIWGMVLPGILEDNMMGPDMMKDPPDFIFLIISHLIGSFALSTIYGKWARGYHSAGGGLEYGIWIGIFAGISYALLWYATATMMDLSGHIIDGVATLIFFALIGAVIALVHKATSTNEASS